MDPALGRKFIANPPAKGSLMEELYRPYARLLNDDGSDVAPPWRSLGRAHVVKQHAREASKHALELAGLPRDLDVGSFAPSSPTIAHASYIGASDIGAILGCDPYRTALDVWARKTGRVGSDSSMEMDAGNDHESGVIRGYTRRMKRAGLVDLVDYPGPGTITIAERIGPTSQAWRGATLDAIAHHRVHGPIALEAKMVGAGGAHAWGPEPAGGEAIPERVLVQVHWQTMHLRERHRVAAPVAHVAADIMGTDRRVYEVIIDDELIAALLDAMRAWWLRHVWHGEMPEVTDRDIATLGRVFPTAERPLSPIVPYEIRELAEEYAIGREITLRHHVETQKLGARLRAMLGDAEGYKWKGGKVTWREAADGSRRLYVRIRRTDE